MNDYEGKYSIPSNLLLGPYQHSRFSSLVSSNLTVPALKQRTLNNQFDTCINYSIFSYTSLSKTSSSCLGSLSQQKLKKAEDLKGNVNLNIQGKQLSCPKCSKTFQRTLTLKVHLDTHKQDKPLKCNSRKFKILKTFCKIKGNLEEQRQTREYSLAQEIEKENRIIKKESKVGKAKCNLCEKIYIKFINQSSITKTVFQNKREAQRQ